MLQYVNKAVGFVILSISFIKVKPYLIKKKLTETPSETCFRK